VLEDQPGFNIGDSEIFDNATKITSKQFLLVKKGMSMRQVMETLGDTWYMMGQGSGVMYYYVDEKPLKIDFIDLEDPYPYSGEEMKQLFDDYGAVTAKTVFLDDLMLLEENMRIENITYVLGKTIDKDAKQKSGTTEQHALTYSVWCGEWFVELTFTSKGGEMPYSSEEIHAKAKEAKKDEKVEISW